MANITSLIKKFSNYIAVHYGSNPANMLIHTGVIGWVLSSAAQVVAILINDKISKKDKFYMIPQEIADAMVNIVSFYAVTQSFKSFTSKAVNIGKILPGYVRNFLKTNNIKNVGTASFDVLKDGNLTPELAKKFEKFRNGMDVKATTIGSIISCNILTPIIRNEIAANRQKRSLDKDEEKKITLNNPIKKNDIKAPNVTAFKGRNPYPSNPYMSSFNLKI